MTDTTPANDTHAYAIRIGGRLDVRWAAWFDDVTLAPQPDGTTVLESRALDQAALHGLLRQVRDAGLTLVSVTRIDAP